MVEKCVPSATLGLPGLFTEKVCFAFEGSTIVSTKKPPFTLDWRLSFNAGFQNILSHRRPRTEQTQHSLQPHHSRHDFPLCLPERATEKPGHRRGSAFPADPLTFSRPVPPLREASV